MTQTSRNPWAGRAIVLLSMIMMLIGRAAAAAEEVGWVAALDGTAEVQRGGAWTALAQGDTVQLGDHVRTAAESRVKLLLRDDSVLTLAERSELVIDEQVAGAAPTSNFSLLLGKVRAIVNDRYGAKGAEFEVKSPTAIAGVRGTSFVAAYDQGRDETQVVGLEHTTTVHSVADPNGNKKVMVGPGQSTTVKRGQIPTLPARLPDSAIRTLTGETTASGQGKKGGQNTTAEPRVPHRPGERAQSEQGRVVDQPITIIQKGPIAPPPPPVH